MQRLDQLRPTVIYLPYVVLDHTTPSNPIINDFCLSSFLSSITTIIQLPDLIQLALINPVYINT